MPIATILAALRENQEEVVRRWIDGCHGSIAEEFEQMLLTPMGRGVASSLLSLFVRFLEAEEYDKPRLLRELRDCAADAAFRRAAVGFSLPDIVVTALAFRNAVQETIVNHANTEDQEGSRLLLECFIDLNRMGDAMVNGEIAGFFTYNQFGQDEEEENVVAL